MNNILFVDNPLAYDREGKYYKAVVSKNILSENQLFAELNEILRLPDYFGFNKDSLSDCLRDLHWIEEKVTVIIHQDLPKLKDEELKAYLEILTDALKNQEEDKDRELEVIFPSTVKKEIDALIQ